MNTVFTFMTRSPKLHGKARQYGASYRRMAIVEHEAGTVPKMISARAAGVVRIVEEVTASVGQTERSAGLRAMRRMQARTAELNAARNHCQTCGSHWETWPVGPDGKPYCHHEGTDQ